MLAPLDAARSGLMRAFARPFAGLFADRSARVALLGTATVLVALALACATPRLALLYGPLLLGVPHLVSELRYLVVLPGLHRRPAVVLLALAPCFVALAAPTVTIAGISVVGAAVAARGRTRTRFLVALTGLGLAALGASGGRVATIVFAHLHHAIAFVWLFFGLARDTRSRRATLLPAGLGAVAAIAIAFGVIVAHPFAFDVGVGDAAMLRDTLSPFADEVLADRFVMLFVFGQSAHYAAWLRLAPELARGRRAPRSFRRSYVALREDVGAAFLVAGALLVFAFLVGASVDAPFARATYLRLALFHGPLELSLAAIAFIESEADRCQ